MNSNIKTYLKGWIIPIVSGAVLLAVIIGLKITHDSIYAHTPRVFGATYMTMNNPYFSVLNESMREVIEANGDILLTRDPAQSQERQNKQILEMIDEGMEVLFANPVDWKAIKPALEACKKAKVAVFVVDTEVQDTENVVSVIQSDNYKAGELVAEDMMKRLPGGGNIVVLSHYNVQSTQVRKNGFLDKIKGHDKYKIVATSHQSSEIEVANMEMDNIIKSGVKIDVVFGNNDPTAVGALAAIEMNKLSEAGILVYGVDGSPYAKQLISKGYMVGTAAQHPVVMGRTAANTAYDYLKNKKVDKNIIIDVDMITKDNLDKININEWQ